MRYFYADVIAAMHMAKHYDMKYHWYNGYGKEWIYGGKDSVDDPWDFWSVGHDDVIRPTHGEKHIIHPDSLEILEPKVGDLIVTRRTFNGKEVRGRKNEYHFITNIFPPKDEVLYTPYHTIVSCSDYPSRRTIMNDEAESYSATIKWAKADFLESFRRVVQRDGEPFFWPESEPATNPTSKAE